MRANELELLRANGVEPCLLMDNGGKTGRLPFSEAALALRPGVDLLDNGHLVDPVNQQGLKEYTAGGRTIDRWIASPGLVVAIEDGFVKLQNDTDQSKFFIQNIEPDMLKRISNNNVTTSFLHKGDGFQSSFRWRTDSEDYVNVAYKNFARTNDFLVDSMGAFLPALDITPNLLQLLVQVNPRTVLYFKAIKLELSLYQTLAHKEGDTWVLNDPAPNKALELLKCQRYFAAIQLGGKHAVAINQTEVHLSGIDYPVCMRANPTLSLSENVNLRVPSKSLNVVQTIKSITNYGTPSSANTFIQNFSGLTPGDVCYIEGYITLYADANL